MKLVVSFVLFFKNDAYVGEDSPFNFVFSYSHLDEYDMLEFFFDLTCSTPSNDVKLMRLFFFHTFDVGGAIFPQT